MNDRILRRAKHLTPEDRRLLFDIFRGGMSIADAAQEHQVHRVTAQRRVRRLLQHLASDLFSFILVHLDGWPQERAMVARLRFLERRSLREVARRSGLSLHGVRLHADAILAQYEAYRG